MAESGTAGEPSTALRGALVPLALAQFICSFAGSNMNVMINDISEDLDTTVQGVQVAITAFLLVMAALMIPGGKLTDRYGRKRCFTIGLVVYCVGALLSAVSPSLGVLILGNSILEGIGTALLIPPVYILTTLLFTDLTSRAGAFGAISAMGGVGAAAGPLIGGVITSGISWRAAFVFQALIIALIVLLSRRIKDPLPPDPTRPFDTVGAILSAVGLVLIVLGILAADNNGWLMIALIAAGALVLVWFFLSVRAKERAGKEPLLSTSLFQNRTSNLGLVTQNIQWLLLLGVSFVVAAYLQVVRGYNAIETGVIFTAATVGLLVSSLAAERFAKRRTQRTLIMVGFVITIIGMGVLLAMASGSPSAWAFAPGLFLIGFGLGGALTPSVNVVQSSFGDERQGEISGLSRSVSNLGSSLGTAIAGTILVAGLTNNAYGAAIITLGLIGLLGLLAAALLPRRLTPITTPTALAKEAAPPKCEPQATQAVLVTEHPREACLHGASLRPSDSAAVRSIVINWSDSDYVRGRDTSSPEPTPTVIVGSRSSCPIRASWPGRSQASSVNCPGFFSAECHFPRPSSCRRSGWQGRSARAWLTWESHPYPGLGYPGVALVRRNGPAMPTALLPRGPRRAPWEVIGDWHLRGWNGSQLAVLEAASRI